MDAYLKAIVAFTDKWKSGGVILILFIILNPSNNTALDVLLKEAQKPHYYAH